MKIALLHRQLGRWAGGLEASLYKIAEVLVKKGHEPVGICAPRPEVLPADAMPPGVPVEWIDVPGRWRLPLPLFASYQWLDAAARGLRRVSGDVDAFWTRSYQVTLAASRVAHGRPVIFIQAGPESPFWRMLEGRGSLLARLRLEYRCRTHDWLERRAMECATHLVYISEARRKETLEIHGERFRPKSHVIPLGVNIERFRPAGKEKAPNGHLKILTVCRLSPEKNLPCLLMAVARLKAKGVDVSSVIVGDGPMREAWESLSRELGVDDRVWFAGHRENVETLYRDANVFVLPSVYEGFGQVYVEALASGLPCVAIRRHEPDVLVAADEIIEHGRTGLLIDDNSPELLADALEGLQRDPDRLRRWGRNARQSAETRFTWDRMIDGLLELSSSQARVGGIEP